MPFQGLFLVEKKKLFLHIFSQDYHGNGDMKEPVKQENWNTVIIAHLSEHKHYVLQREKYGSSPGGEKMNED